MGFLDKIYIGLIIVLLTLSGVQYFEKSHLQTQVIQLTSVITQCKSNTTLLESKIADQNAAIDQLHQVEIQREQEFNSKLEAANNIDSSSKDKVQLIYKTTVDSTCQGSMKWLQEQSSQLSSWH